MPSSGFSGDAFALRDPGLQARCMLPSPLVEEPFFIPKNSRPSGNRFHKIFGGRLLLVELAMCATWHAFCLRRGGLFTEKQLHTPIPAGRLSAPQGERRAAISSAKVAAMMYWALTRM